MFRAFLFVSFMCAALSAQVVRIEGDIRDDQVIQRDAAGAADIRLAGSASGAEKQAVEARVIGRGIPAAGSDWRKVASVAGGRWSGTLAAVPAGGPYRIEVRIAGTQAADKITGLLVGDLWLLSGQSDMEGRGYLTEATPPHPMVHSFDMRDHWVVAEDPLHTRVDAVDRIYWFNDEKNIPAPFTGEKLRNYLKWRDRGVGLGVSFGAEMVRRTAVPVGLVPCALGGTSMDQWAPALKSKGGDSLYGAMLRRARAAGGRFRGILWSQGAGDAYGTRAPAFAAKVERLVASLREDLGQPDLPFYYVQIGRFVTDENIGAGWNVIQEEQRKAEASIPHSGMVATVDEGLVDLAHADAASLKRLGARLAKLACHDLFPQVNDCAFIERGPRPVSAVYFEDEDPTGWKYREKKIRLTLQSVNGAVRAPGRISGFTIHNGAGGPLPLIYGVDVDPADRRSILIHVTDKPPAGAVLRYGYGMDPYCNVVDEHDLPLPAFGPMEIR